MRYCGADPATAGGSRGSIFVVWEKLTASGVLRRKKTNATNLALLAATRFDS